MIERSSGLFRFSQPTPKRRATLVRWDSSYSDPRNRASGPGCPVSRCGSGRAPRCSPTMSTPKPPRPVCWGSSTRPSLRSRSRSRPPRARGTERVIMRRAALRRRAPNGGGRASSPRWRSGCRSSSRAARPRHPPLSFRPKAPPRPLRRRRAGEQVPEPAIASPDDLAGTDVRVVIGSALVVAVPDGTEAEWTGTTADVTIAEFLRRRTLGGRGVPPGFIARALGTTAATVTGLTGSRSTSRSPWWRLKRRPLVISCRAGVFEARPFVARGRAAEDRAPARRCAAPFP